MLKLPIVLIRFLSKGKFNFENEKETAQDVKQTPNLKKSLTSVQIRIPL